MFIPVAGQDLHTSNKCVQITRTGLPQRMAAPGVGTGCGVLGDMDDG